MKKKREELKRILSYLIDDKLTYSKIESLMGYKKGTIKVKIHRAKKKGYIIYRGENYQFTEKGNQLYRRVKRIVTDSEQIINIHFHRIKAKIIKKNLIKKSSDFLHKVETIIQVKRLQQEEDYEISYLNNTRIYIFKKLYGTEIRATSRSILIKVPRQVSMSIDHCLKLTEEYFKEIIPKIERYFDIVLDTRFINQFYVSSRHIELMDHMLARIHKKYGLMHIEVLDNETGERKLYFDESGRKLNSETASTREGIEIAENLETFDRDIVNGYSMSKNSESIIKVDEKINQFTTSIDKLNQSIRLEIYNKQLHLKVLQDIRDSINVSNLKQSHNINIQKLKQIQDKIKDKADIFKLGDEIKLLNQTEQDLLWEWWTDKYKIQ